ncbi:DUF397 domain-containing protein [Streptomyces sp. DSM 41527]|uniref:DUF397 domain-containing protein n=1 Tax=Streptomyces mooreae TaxID=3075523 RepID=A0ABU2TB77_9ACTN|nr:DUF397 domain-containing protein [Streptomyces sp. DSM 41527]MDT0458174.1 DUF397 domain-containing protein [Streptomyces sp. DSM 41527]
MTDRPLSGIEVPAPTWFKSSYSGGEGNACLEVAHAGTRVAVRDSKDPDGPTLAFPAAAFAAFINEVRGASADGRPV